MSRIPIPVVGGHSKGRSVKADSQEAVNLFPCYDKEGGRDHLKGTPGLKCEINLSPRLRVSSLGLLRTGSEDSDYLKIF